jgi:hypothetical protein
MAGKHDQAISEDADGDEHLFTTLRSAVEWWTRILYQMLRNKPKDPAVTRMELADCIQKLEEGHFRKNPGDHCRYCPVVDTCMGLKP